MVCLGIESTAHTFGAGIVDEKCNILANEKHSYTTESGGMIPREIADHHLQWAESVLKNALQKAGVGIKDIDVFAFAQGPGMGPALKVGAVATRTLALLHNKPLLGVNHPVAHIEIGKKLCGSRDPLVVYASGGNSQIIGYESNCYRVFGETLDIGIGNLFDSFGRELGIGFPAGPKIDEMYFLGKTLIELPYTVKGMDLVFSGLLTVASKKAKSHSKEDLCYSLMHTSIAMLCEVTERALAHTGKKEVLLTGGVACSKALQKMFQEMCDARGVKLFVTPPAVAIDNGLMIAWLGLLMHKSGVKMSVSETRVNQKFRTDHVKVTWKV
ncbi:MAG: KEOPS complex N(6)-L-threonylcarbamoyladenine synthase Kae1 [archaeon]